MRPTRRTVLAATVSTIALAGCAGDGIETETPDSDGGGGDDGGGADGDSETPTQSPPPDPTASPTSSPASESPTSTTMDSATVQVRAHPDLGEILVDSEGMTLYMFDSDTQGEGASTCSGGCADAWPPLTVDGEPSAGVDVTADLTTFEREDGSTQVAASGWPLYYFASDEQPGDAGGEGANGVWWVLDPAGRPVRPSTPTATATPTDTPGDGDGGVY